MGSIRGNYFMGGRFVPYNPADAREAAAVAYLTRLGVRPRGAISTRTKMPVRSGRNVGVAGWTKSKGSLREVLNGTAYMSKGGKTAADYANMSTKKLNALMARADRLPTDRELMARRAAGERLKAYRQRRTLAELPFAGEETLGSGMRRKKRGAARRRGGFVLPLAASLLAPFAQGAAAKLFGSGMPLTHTSVGYGVRGLNPAGYKGGAFYRVP